MAYLKNPEVVDVVKGDGHLHDSIEEWHLDDELLMCRVECGQFPLMADVAIKNEFSRLHGLPNSIADRRTFVSTNCQVRFNDLNKTFPAHAIVLNHGSMDRDELLEIKVQIPPAECYSDCGYTITAVSNFSVTLEVKQTPHRHDTE